MELYRVLHAAHTVAKTKGISFVNAKAFCDARGGDAWERVLSIMDTADRASSSWWVARSRS